MASTKNCYFKCKTNYTWNSSTSTCVADTQPANCTGLPSNAQWNTVSEITQTWNGENWQPSTEGSYNETSSTTECYYKCKSGYFWNGSVCKVIRTLGEICTGQTKCYNNSSSITCPTSTSADFYGQDAQYRGKCIAQSFTVQTLSSQKVVLDNNTGLMWQQTIPTKYTSENAVSYCSNLTYGGYSDWRLPTTGELLTIVDNSRYDPAINTSYFPDTPSEPFWASNCMESTSSDKAGCVNFQEGVSASCYKKDTYKYNVRCVRGRTLPTNSFNSSTVNGYVIVTDTKTGLIWQKSYERYKTWKEALKYCENLTYAGYSDWRLPNKNESASLRNYQQCDQGSNFPGISSYHFWSSSTYTGTTTKAWGSQQGSVCSSTKTNGDDSAHTDGISVRCVR